MQFVLEDSCMLEYDTVLISKYILSAYYKMKSNKRTTQILLAFWKIFLCVS